jgi:hypothetical protein
MDKGSGTLIAYQDAIKWLNDNKLIELVFKLASWRQRISLSNRETQGAQEIAGAIFETQLTYLIQLILQLKKHNEYISNIQNKTH